MLEARVRADRLRLTPFRHFVCGAGVHRLSGGQMRRVSIGTELVAEGNRLHREAVCNS